MSYTVLYILWGALFAASACMGFLPAPEAKAAQAVFRLAATCVFVPPWLILFRAGKENGKKHRALVRNLSLASIGATTVLLALNIMSARWPEQVGDALHAALVVVSAPMVCGQNYMLSLFAWGILLMASIGKSKPRHR